MEKQYRTIEIEHSRANDETRTVEASLSSETPIERYYGKEVLRHTPDAVDLSRAPLPLLTNHESQEIPIGIVENLHIVGRKLRGVLRFGKSQKASEVWEDVKGGILRSLSIGYEIKAHEKTEGGIIATKWAPLEASIVGIPADATVGIGRNYENHERKIMMEHHEEKDLNREQRRALTHEERERCSTISTMGKMHNVVEIADKAISEGTPVETFRGILIAELEKRKVVINSGYEPVGMSDKELSRYSLTRALNALVTSKWNEAPFEMEVSRAAQKQRRKETEGIIIPFEVFTRAVTKGGSGGSLIVTDLLASAFIDLLRNQSLVLQLGATVLTGLSGDVVIPRQTGAAAGYWVAEGNDVTESTPTYDQVTLTPKTLGGLCSFTRKMLLQSSPGIEDLLRRDLASVLAIEMDRASINGSGASNQPLGIMQTTGIGSVAGGTNGAAPTWAHIVGLESEVAVDNADLGRLEYFTNTKVRGKLKQTFTNSTYGEVPIWTEGDEMGRLNGYPAGASNNVPSNLTKGTSSGVCSAILFGNWADLLVGIWGNGVELMVDPYTSFKSGTVWIRALVDCDIAVRHPESFAAMLDVLTT